MALGIGLNAWLSIQKESSWAGTASGTAEGMQIVSEDIKHVQELIEALTVSSVGINESLVSKGKVQIDGTAKFPLTYEVMGHFLYGAFGINSRTTAGTASPYTHTFYLQDTLPSYIIKVNRDNALFTFTGCKIDMLEFNCPAIGSPVEATATILGRNASTAAGTSTITPAITESLSTYTGINTQLQWAGTAGSNSVMCENFQMTINNELDKESFVLDGSGLRAEPVRNNKRRVTCRTKAWFDTQTSTSYGGTTLYSDFVNATSRTLILTANGPSSGATYSFVLTANAAKIKTFPVAVTGMGKILVETDIDCFVKADNSSDEVKLDWKNTISNATAGSLGW